MATKEKTKKIVGQAPNKRELKWSEFGAILSKARYLFGDEEITQITLVKPKTLLLHTERPIYATEED